ncbi:hypothetical protein [Nostoc sp. UHCC 0251]|uniref:hypothetical protein n=1 Tax=Nostoc sp. UHCC 0251 TaxID=3110240 RepID=UPI002B1ED408|nr:hypothetical protein [Nostoc sp. UHCC 0251]MEA5623069.1 hypothetical protein [Nostoc sp. UHCC 0251]
MKNFSLSLYAFHLRHTLTELPGEVVTDANLLWENLVKVGEGSLTFVGLKDLRSKLVCYQNGEYEPKREIGRIPERLIDAQDLDLGSLPTIDSGKSPQSWQDFINKDCKKWQEQIQTYINYLTPGQELFGQLVDTIRGIVETEQTERDRSLENTIQVLGIGFGGGAIISGVIVQHIDKINQPLTPISPNNPPHPFYASLLLSIFATLLFIALGWCWINKGQGRKN